MLLFNPTETEMVWLYGGSPYRVPAEGTAEFPDKVGNHLLLHLSPIGLQELKHGDKKAEKAKVGLATRTTFLKRQIKEFRQMNENRKNAGFPPLVPSESLIKIVRDVEGDESADRLEYSSQETATMMLEKMVKTSVEGKGDMAEAMTVLSNAVAQLLANQDAQNNRIADILERLADKEEEE